MRPRRSRLNPHLVLARQKVVHRRHGKRIPHQITLRFRPDVRLHSAKRRLQKARVTHKRFRKRLKQRKRYELSNQASRDLGLRTKGLAFMRVPREPLVLLGGAALHSVVTPTLTDRVGRRITSPDNGKTADASAERVPDPVTTHTGPRRPPHGTSVHENVPSASAAPDPPRQIPSTSMVTRTASASSPGKHATSSRNDS